MHVFSTGLYQQPADRDESEELEGLQSGTLNDTRDGETYLREQRPSCSKPLRVAVCIALCVAGAMAAWLRYLPSTPATTGLAAFRPSNDTANGSPFRSFDPVFPYGKCLGEHRANGECHRPFAWVKRENLSDMYSDIEIASINGSCKLQPEFCCISAASTGAGNKYNKNICSANAKPHSELGSHRYTPLYDQEFVPEGEGPRTLFDLAQALSLMPSGTRVTFVGDSVSHQTFEGLLCSLARSPLGQVDEFNCYYRKKVSWPIGTGERDAVWVSVTHPGEKKKSYLLRNHRDYRFDEAGLTIREVCTDTDILVFNFGLHWNDLGSWKRNSKRLVEILEAECISKGVRIVFRGTTPQHFLRYGGHFGKISTDYLKNEIHANLTNVGQSPLNKIDRLGCGPIVVRNITEDYDFRNPTLVQAFREAGWDVAITPWGNEDTPGCQRMMKTAFYIPIGEAFMDRYDMHGTECTHYCSTPALWNVVADGLYMAFWQMQKNQCAKPIVREKPLKPSSSGFKVDKCANDDPKNFVEGSIGTIYKIN